MLRQVDITTTPHYAIFMMHNINKIGTGNLTTETAAAAARQFGTPLYLYDEAVIRQKCREVLAMPHAYGLGVRYAMKANSNKALLQLISRQGIGIDASSLNEVRRALLAGAGHRQIMYTSQEIPLGSDRTDLEAMLLKGLKYNICSFRQLELVAGFAVAHKIPVSVRVNPGTGSGESVTRQTADKYASFGIYQDEFQPVVDYARARGLVIDQVHAHIGSGGDPEVWRGNIDIELGITERYFPDASTVNFGGGFREARMPDETAADIRSLGEYASKRFEEFYHRTGRKLRMEVEPGTYIMANAGFIVTSVMDKKNTGETGFKFLLLDAGMELNTRPLMYGSRHPFYVVSKQGRLLSSEFIQDAGSDKFVIVGRCCESGDSQSLDSSGHIVPRAVAEPALDDYVIIGGAGAYCSAMSPFNYNSHYQAPEILLREDGKLQVIRKRQSLEQITANEEPL